MTLPTPPRVLQAPPGKAEEASHDGSQRPAVKTDDGTAMYGIRFMVPNGKIPGYLVKVGRRNVNHTKWFGIAQYGDKSRALAAARAWRDEQIGRLPLVTKQEYVSHVRPNNTSGATGVIRITRRHRKRSGQVVSVEYWLARPPRCLKISQKGFSIARYGEERAWQLAVEARREMERLISGYYVPNVPDEFVARAVARG